MRPSPHLTRCVARAVWWGRLVGVVAGSALVGCHSSFQPFPDAIACAGATVRKVGVDADSSAILYLSNRNDVVWRGWKDGVRRDFVSYHESSTSSDTLPADLTPVGVNASGVVAARSTTGPALYDHGTVTRIPVPASWTALAPTTISGTSTWVPIGINDSGYVAMRTFASDGNAAVLLWRNGAAPTGVWGPSLGGIAVTNANMVLSSTPSLSSPVGITSGLYYPDGRVVGLGNTSLSAFNDLGYVSYQLGAPDNGVRLRAPDGTLSALPFLPTGMNNTLQMIGFQNAGTASQYPVYAVGGASVRLSRALDDLRIELLNPMAINNNGTIAVNAYDGGLARFIGLTFNASACTLR